jgi:Flp pilus assembly protein TadG
MTRPAQEEEGSVTLWTLGAVLLVLVLGGLAFDLNAGFAARRTLAAAADSAAQAGANALDVAAYRRDGTRQLDPTLAEQLATESLAGQGLTQLTGQTITADTQSVAVTLEADVDLGLLRIFGDGEPLRVRVTATGAPRAQGATP